MNIEQREKWIIDQLKDKGSVKIATISQQLGISRETIRKDIYALDQQGAVHAVRGGAVLPDSMRETRYELRQQLNPDAKQYIAEKAVDLIRNGSTIFLDYGSTCVTIADQLKSSNFTELTVVTDSIHVLHTLQTQQNISAIILGGNYRYEEGSVSGPLTLSNIENIYCDLGFFGCGAISPETGLTNYYFSEVEVSKRMMAHCHTTAVVADQSKFGKTGVYKTADLSAYDVLVSDMTVPNEYQTFIRDSHVRFVN